MLKRTPLLMVSLLWAGLAHAEKKGVLGFRYSQQPEGMVITKVVEGSGAASAGIVVGDRIVSVDGVDVVDAEEPPSLKGPEGASVQFGIISALSSEKRDLTVTRGPPPPKKDKPKEASPRVISRFAGAIYSGKISDVKGATTALIKADFAGKDPKDAIGRHLIRAIKRKRKKVVRAALSVLSEAPNPAAGLQYRIGQAYWFLDDEHATAVKWLTSLLETYPNDTARSLGSRGMEEEWLANSLWLSGDKAGAIDLTRQIVGRRQVDLLLKRVGMANPTPMEPWAVRLPPVDEVDVELLDGSDWSLSSQKGKPVVLVFWATWCGPCKKEMPALADLKRKRPNWPVEFLAISTDKSSAAGKVNKLVKDWDLPFPVTRTDELNGRFGVTGLPSMRVIGADGTLRSSSRGYSKSSIKKLVNKLDDLVAEVSDPTKQKSAFPYGKAWGENQPTVRSIFGHEEVRSIAASGSHVALQIRGHGPFSAPLEAGTIAGSLEVEETQKATGEKGIAWFGGPLSYGVNWVRARNENGDTSWFATTPNQIVSVASSGDQLWVALEDGLLAFDETGVVVHNLDVSVHDLAPAEDGGIWAVDGEERLRIGPDGSALLRDEAKGAQQIAGDGTWTGEGITELIAGRFGPEGSTRIVGLNQRNTIVGLDGNGVAALRISLDNDKAPNIAHADLDGDGQDELLISSRGRGVATVELEIP